MMSDNLKILFTINTDGTLFSFINNAKEVMQCNFKNDMLTVSITYDFKDEQPLCLSANAKISDKVEIVILAYRIELYVNGSLCDEEWPCGNHYLENSEIKKGNCDLRIEKYEPQEPYKETVTGTFINAEGWRPEDKVYVGDCMPYCFNGEYHVLYLKDRHHHKSKWGLGAHQWEHISTNDFVTWHIHPMAVAIDSPDEGSICTGSWIYSGNTHYLFYTIRSCDGSPAKICRSVSNDGYHFEKDRNFSFTLSELYTRESARDPKVIKDENDLYHMFLTTSLTENGLGCLAHLVSEDLQRWVEMPEPLYIAPKGMGEPECSDYFFKDGYYYLVYSMHGAAYYQFSKKPFTDWQIPNDPIIPCKLVPKGAIWNDRLIFTGFDRIGNYAGTMTFLEAEVQENGELSYKKFE